jgi:Tfp pilus assembly protein PilX
MKHKSQQEEGFILLIIVLVLMLLGAIALAFLRVQRAAQ